MEKTRRSLHKSSSVSKYTSQTKVAWLRNIPLFVCNGWRELLQIITLSKWVWMLTAFFVDLCIMMATMVWFHVNFGFIGSWLVGGIISQFWLLYLWIQELRRRAKIRKTEGWEVSQERSSAALQEFKKIVDGDTT